LGKQAKRQRDRVFLFRSAKRVIPGLSFFVFSVIHVKERQSYPIQAVQMVKHYPEPVEEKAKKKLVNKEKRPVGRPKGSQKKKNEKPRLSPELLRIQPVLQAFLVILKGVLAVEYLVQMTCKKSMAI